MTPAVLSAHPTGPLHDALEPWCAVGATGALRLLEAPGGSVYLIDGRISYAECPPACGLDRLLTTAGRLSADAWRTALNAGRPTKRVGETLVQQGLIGPVELESAVLTALYGAAHFLFDMKSETRFEMGVGHPIGPVVSLELRAVCAELDRRRRLLSDTWPDSTLDDHAVLPARRLLGHHVTLTALQWEIVANADRRRTPIELARSLGRDTFATLLEVRRLARAGLVEPGRPGTVGPSPGSVGTMARGTGTARSPDAAPSEPPLGNHPRHLAPDAAPRAHPAPPAPPAQPAPRAQPAPPAPPVPPAQPAPSARQPSAEVPVPLPRRSARTETWLPAIRDGQADGSPPVERCPDSALVRIRDALESLP